MSKRCLLLACAATLFIPMAAHAQTQPQRVSVRASTEYEASEFWELLFGSNWRDVWAAQLSAPVLDLGSYAGGITPFKAGGNQSRTLRFRGADGRTYIFRSTNKDVQRSALPSDLRYTPVGEVIQDVTSSMHPTGSLAAAVLTEAVDVLHAMPTLVYMPDDRRLGEFRKDFANMLGQIEERPDEAEKGTTFAGAEKIVGTDKLLENLEESMEDRFESREYLKARLIDFIIGDTDRGADQWRFAKIEAGDRDVYRPIPRDHDYAFMNIGGALIRLGAMLYPKLTSYSERYPGLGTLTFMTHEFDRSHLVDLSPEAWDSIVTFIQQRLTNDVIDRAVAQLPPEHRRLSGAEITSGLRGRRDSLRDIAQKYFAMVNEDASIFGSDEDERAEIVRNADGSVTVRIWREDDGDSATNGQSAPVFDRRFAPDETDEIRVHLERGNDRAIVRGDVERSIEVRVIGGEGDDVLIDSSRVAHGDKTHFYDALGNNTLVEGPHTRVIRKPFVTTAPKCSLDEEDECEEKQPRILSEERRGRQQDLVNNDQDFITAKTRTQQARTWGQSHSWTPLVSYREGSGVVLGIGPTITDYGFRRSPYESRVALHAMVGALSGRLGVQLNADRYFEVSPFAVSLFAHATQLEANRFYGLGNDSPERSRSETLVQRDELLVMPAVSWVPNLATRLSVGPVLRYAKPDGSTSYGQAGGRLEFVWDDAARIPVRQSGFALQGGVAAYPAMLDVDNAFTTADALARLYVPIGNTTVALRAGGRRVWGDGFPLWEAAFVGGSTSLRGYAWNRYAGDASAFGSAELRLPLARVTLLTRGDLGIIGFTDAGRVWFNGESNGGWHTSYGGGLFFGSLGQTVSVTYAQGEAGRFYLSLGHPF